LINICSFIEIKWVIFHCIKKNPEKKTEFLNRYQEAILYFSKAPQFKLLSFLNLEIDALSNQIRDAGILDYFDATICATAQAQEATLITEDATIHQKSIQKLIPVKAMDWKTFITQI
jgi:predicted nucleic acid-binding protein